VTAYARRILGQCTWFQELGGLSIAARGRRIAQRTTTTCRSIAIECRFGLKTYYECRNLLQVSFWDY